MRANYTRSLPSSLVSGIGASGVAGSTAGQGSDPSARRVSRVQRLKVSEADGLWSLRACLKMGRGSVWEGRVRLARREEGADPQRSVTDKQRRQRALPSQTLRAAGLSGLDCVGSGGTDRRKSAPPLTALPNPEFPSRRTPPHFQTGSQGIFSSAASDQIQESTHRLHACRSCRPFRGDG